MLNARLGVIEKTRGGHGSAINSIDLKFGGEILATASFDHTVKLWRTSDLGELVTLIAFTDSTWAAVTPEGRFDTNDLERIEGLHWVAPDDPFTPLGVEVFMRDYYEPRLLSRVSAGEEFPEVGSPETRNRVQPRVQIASVEIEGDTAVVEVEVEGTARWFQRRADSVLVESGAADLRLFRGGQVVRWRDGAIALDPNTGRARIRFEGIPLPDGGADSVTFSAYAFSEDFKAADGSEWVGRVKSKTDYRSLALAERKPRPGRAYLITIGVDAYEDPAWDLSFAADDARALSSALTDAFEAESGATENGPIAEVVPIPLIADQEAGQSTVATKASIRAVLSLLAGEDVSAELLARVPNADRIQRATPEDLVLISFAAHGYADVAGTFYLFPSDIGTGHGKRITPGLLERAVSSDELAAWLRPVDAGEMVLIVDACHSAAAVEGAGFKPGPMGSRGFGQLAFDKGMRVLAASQAEDVALESGLLRQGLLTYALVRDGLEAGQADHEPEDGRIDLGEWLRYGVERVPTLFEEVQAGEVETFGRTMVGLEADRAEDGDPFFQRPALFDFRKAHAEIVLHTVPDQ